MLQGKGSTVMLSTALLSLTLASVEKKVSVHMDTDGLVNGLKTC